MTRQTVHSKTILAFKNSLLLEEKAAAAVEKYIRDVSVFAAYLDRRELTKEIAIAYKQHLSESGYTIRSINSVIASLNRLFLFLGRHDCKLKAIKLQRQIFCPEEKELTRAEYNRLLAAAQKKGNKRLNLLIQTICGTGIRVSELRYITVQAVRDGKAAVNSKNKTQVIFIPVSIQKLLKEYVRSQGIEAGSVFVSKSGKPLNRSNIWRDMKSLCKSAGVSPDKVFPHICRPDVRIRLCAHHSRFWEKEARGMTKRKITVSDVMIGAGLLLVIASVVILIISVTSKQDAVQDAKQIVSELHARMPDVSDTVPDDRVNMTMPAMEVGGESFCGIIEIPPYSTELPICEMWKKNSVDNYPCKYLGSLYDGSLIIGAGDHAELFGFAEKIQNDDIVFITDLTGGRYAYKVSDIRRSKDVSTEYLTSMDADLVLFVKNRLSLDHTVVRCVLIR